MSAIRIHDPADVLGSPDKVEAVREFFKHELDKNGAGLIELDEAGLGLIVNIPPSEMQALPADLDDRCDSNIQNSGFVEEDIDKEMIGNSTSAHYHRKIENRRLREHNNHRRHKEDKPSTIMPYVRRQQHFVAAIRTRPVEYFMSKANILEWTLVGNEAYLQGQDECWYKVKDGLAYEVDPDNKFQPLYREAWGGNDNVHMAGSKEDLQGFPIIEGIGIMENIV